MKSETVNKWIVRASFFVLIGIGLIISPEQQTVAEWYETMNPGKWVTVIGIVGAIAYFSVMFGKSLAKKKNESSS